jgi:DNA replicative helicase MCM subunit Mcm2 (Cdc46/Mcm family)
LIFVFKKRKSEKEIDEFVDKLSEVEDKKDKGRLPNYTTFLIKYIQYAKQINPILTEETRTMLKEFYKKIGIKGFGSPRVLITLFKLAKAIARLKLKEIVDETDATETMDFYNVMLFEFQKSVVISQSPREIAYQECVSLLQQFTEYGGIQLEELITLACQRNIQLADYFQYGKKTFKIENNKKIRNIYEMLLNHSKIKRVQEKPIVLKWLSDPTDLSDPLSKAKTENITEKLNELTSESRSVKSDRSDNNEESLVDDECNFKLLRVSNNIKKEALEMTKEQYNSWNGGNQK